MYLVRLLIRRSRVRISQFPPSQIRKAHYRNNSGLFCFSALTDCLQTAVHGFAPSTSASKAPQHHYRVMVECHRSAIFLALGHCAFLHIGGCVQTWAYLLQFWLHRWRVSWGRLLKRYPLRRKSSHIIQIWTIHSSHQNGSGCVYLAQWCQRQH